MISDEKRRELEKAMEERRDLLGKRWRAVAADGGISYETVRAVRKGTGDIPAPTRRALERGLNWPVGHIDEILMGHERPVEQPTDVDEELLAHFHGQRRKFIRNNASPELIHAYIAAVDSMQETLEPDIDRYIRTVKRFAAEVAAEVEQERAARRRHAAEAG